jgi:hypothetical protein
MAQLKFVLQHVTTEIRCSLMIEAPSLSECWRVSPIQRITEFAGEPCDPPAWPNYRDRDGDNWGIVEIFEEGATYAVHVAGTPNPISINAENRIAAGLCGKRISEENPGRRVWILEDSRHVQCWLDGREVPG